MYQLVTFVIQTVLFLDEQSGKTSSHKAKAPSPFRSAVNNAGDNDLFVNPDSIVTIMVESPKDPPNSDFATSFSSPPPPKSDEPDESMTDADAADVCESNVVIDDIQEPIDVNTPRDTTNIFYAYEETDENFSGAQIAIEQSSVVDTNQINSDASQVNIQQSSESTADQIEFTENVIVDVGPANETATVHSDRRSSSSS